MEYTILLQILITISLIILILLRKKINIRKSYKIIIGTFLFIINFIGILLMSVYSNAIKHNNSIIEEFFPNGNYENLIFCTPILVGIGIIIFYFIRISLGNIDIKIYGNKLISGDNLTGEINLKLTKDIKNSNLYIYLRGYQHIQTTGSSGGARKKKYEDKIILEQNSFFESNHVKNYNFTFNIPYLEKKICKGYNEEELEKQYNAKGLTEYQKQMGLKLANMISNSALKSSLKNQGKDSLKLWKIEIRLEKDGIDLFNEKIVNVVRKLKN